MGKYKIKHIVSTRFLLLDMFNNGQIFDFEYQKNATNVLLNHFIKTIQNTEDKDFECVILTHENNKEYVESINFPIEVKVFTCDGLIEYIKSSIPYYDYIIHTSSDYDDFFHKDNIGLIKKSIKENTEFKMYGFVNGATMVDNEKIPHFFRLPYFGKDGFFTCCTSIIYNTKINFSNEFPYLIHDVAKKYNWRHSNWKHIIEKEYKNWGLEKLDNDFFDYDDDGVTRFIWIRQPLSFTTIKEGYIHYSEKILNLDLSEFGIKQ